MGVGGGPHNEQGASVDLRPHPLVSFDDTATQPVRPRPSAWGILVALGMLVVAVIGAGAVLDDERSAAERVEAGPRPATAGDVLVLGATAQAGETSPPTSTLAPSTTTARVSPATTVAPDRSLAPPVATTTVTSAPKPLTSLIPVATTQAPTTTVTTLAPTTTVAPTTSTTVPVCRNSNDPVCGPFRFDPQPGPDRPMTIQIVAEPATPQAGQEVVFHITLVDPDGVSYGSSLFGFGDSGIGQSSLKPCDKYGSWTPPVPDASGATAVQDVSHTYAEAGTYTATFAFEAGPYSCVDSATGRGDRPYASSATGTVTVVVV